MAGSYLCFRDRKALASMIARMRRINAIAAELTGTTDDEEILRRLDAIIDEAMSGQSEGSSIVLSVSIGERG